MPESQVERMDPFHTAVIRGEQNFELRGDQLVVPLHFKPDAGFILRAVLTHEGEFTKKDMTRKPGFKEVCEDSYARHRFVRIISDLRFLLDALGSTLILTTEVPDDTPVYQRNPDYQVVDERP